MSEDTEERPLKNTESRPPQAGERIQKKPKLLLFSR